VYLFLAMDEAGHRAAGPRQELAELYEGIGASSTGAGAASAPEDVQRLWERWNVAPPPPARRRRRRRPSLRALLVLLGLVLIAAGVWVIVAPLVGVWQRSRVDQSALSQWHNGGAQAITGGVAGPDASDHPSNCGTQQPAADAYALMTFPSLPQYNYSGVAGDGTWDLLHSRSVVHWHGSADPGQLGNVIIAFHREDHYPHIDELNTGMEVDLQDRNCRLFRYTITSKWVGPPEQVTQLVSTGGHDLTLVTCTPWYRDYNRIVWRATLIN
jgi:sortase A